MLPLFRAVTNYTTKNRLLDAFRTNSRNIIGGNPSMVIPLLANQDLTSMLPDIWLLPHTHLALSAQTFYEQKSTPSHTKANPINCEQTKII